MAMICRKRVQLSWNLDQICISMCFIKFKMIFLKKFENWLIFGLKWRFFPISVLRFWSYNLVLQFKDECLEKKILRSRNKIPFWPIKGVIFLQKLKISKIQNRNFVAGPMKSLYTKIATQKSEKIVVFQPKIGLFSKCFKNHFEFDKTHRNTYLVQIFISMCFIKFDFWCRDSS